MDSIKVLKTLTELKLRKDNNFIKVKGTSMVPVIYDGDAVEVKKCGRYKVGDIVVAIDTKGRLLVHRIVRTGKTGKAAKAGNTTETDGGIIYIKGDNAVAVESVNGNNCIGRVCAVRKPDGDITLVPMRSRDRLVAVFSYMMHKRFVKTQDYVKVMRYQRKLLPQISNIFSFIYSILQYSILRHRDF